MVPRPVVQGRVVRLELDRLGVVAERLLVPVFLGVGARALLQRGHVVGIGGERLRRLGDLAPGFGVRPSRLWAGRRRMVGAREAVGPGAEWLPPPGGAGGAGRTVGGPQASRSARQSSAESAGVAG